MAGGMGHTGGLTNPAPGVEDAEPVILIPVGLSCLKRGRLLKKTPNQEINGMYRHCLLKACLTPQSTPYTDYVEKTMKHSDTL